MKAFWKLSGISEKSDSGGKGVLLLILCIVLFCFPWPLLFSIIEITVTTFTSYVCECTQVWSEDSFINQFSSFHTLRMRLGFEAWWQEPLLASHLGYFLFLLKAYTLKVSFWNFMASVLELTTRWKLIPYVRMYKLRFRTLFSLSLNMFSLREN